MKKSTILLILYLVGIHQIILPAEPKKPSTWANIKGWFGKKKEAPKEAKTIEENEGIPGTLYKIFGDLQTLFKQGYEQIKMLKIKIQNITLVKEEILKISKENDALIKQQYKLIKNDKQQASKQTKSITEKLRLSTERIDHYSGQIGRLRADALSAFIILLKEINPLMGRIQQLLIIAGYSKEQNPVREFMEYCDIIVAKGDSIVEQLLIANNAYGNQTAMRFKNEKVMIAQYLKTVTNLSQSYKKTIENIQGIMKKICFVGKMANAVTFGYMQSLETVPKLIDDIITMCAHVIDFAAEIGSVTEETKEIAQEAQKTTQKLKETIDKNQEKVQKVETLKHTLTAEQKKQHEEEQKKLLEEEKKQIEKDQKELEEEQKKLEQKQKKLAEQKKKLDEEANKNDYSVGGYLKGFLKWMPAIPFVG